MSESNESGKKVRPWYGISTAITIGLSVVACVTGLMLFLKIGVPYVKEAHEWLSVAFVVAAVAHAIRHRRIILRYTGVGSFWLATVVVALATAAFVVPGISGGAGGPGGHGGPWGPGGPGGNAALQSMEILGGAQIGQVAAMAKTSEDVLVERLRDGGITVASPQDTLAALAKAANKGVPDLLSIMLPARPGMGPR